MDLLRADAAVLSVDEVDHSRPRQPSPVAGGLKLRKGLLRPSLAHEKMITVIVTAPMRTVPVWIALVLVIAGCGAAGGEKGKTSVVAAFYPLAYAAEQAGG